MKKVIAKVKLNPGQGGYFDPITRIHLTHGDPEREIYAGMNTEGLKQAVRNKRISLISGSLGDMTPPFKLVKRADGKIVLVSTQQEVKVETPVSVKKDSDVKPVDIKNDTVTKSAEPKVDITGNDIRKVDIKQEETSKPIEEKTPDIVVEDVRRNNDIISDEDISALLNFAKDKPIDITAQEVTVQEDHKITEGVKKNKKKGKKADVED